MNLQEAEARFLAAKEDYDAHWHEALDKPSFKEMQDFLRPYGEKIRTAKIEMIALIDPANLELEDFPDYGDYFTLEEFRDNCECGGFIDNDGTGYFCIGQKMSQISSPPSLILDPRADLHIFDGVYWFNK